MEQRKKRPSEKKKQQQQQHHHKCSLLRCKSKMRIRAYGVYDGFSNKEMKSPYISFVDVEVEVEKTEKHIAQSTKMKNYF